MNIQDKKTNNAKKNGFTLIEVLVSIFIFSLLMVVTFDFFSSSVFGYRNSKAIQKDLENAQYAMNIMTKTLRTSSIIKYGSNGYWIRSYDYSRKTGKCILYQFNSTSNKLESGSSDVADSDKTLCESASITTKEMTASYINNFEFIVVPSSATTDPKVVGRVTISAEVCATNNCAGTAYGEKDAARIQSTVSLRNME